MTSFVIDGSYLYEQWKKVSDGRKLDYRKLLGKVERIAREKFVSAFYFNCCDSKDNPKQAAFFKFLSDPRPTGLGINLKLYWLTTTRHHWQKHIDESQAPVIHPVTGEQYVTQTQKGVDVGLAFHLVMSYLQDRWDTIYLIAGDGDYYEVIHWLAKDKGVRIILLGTSDSVSSLILPLVEFYNLADYVAELALRDQNQSE